MKITLATKDDIDSIIALQPQIYRIESTPPNAAEIFEKLISANDFCDVIVARDENRVVGYACTFYLPIPAHGAPYAYLEGMVVDENVRGKGVGTKLTQKAIELAEKRNCYKFLFVSGMDRSEIHEFYEKLGFKKWGYEFRMNLPQNNSEA